MKPEPEMDLELEALIDRELKQLAALDAPASLLPRVMAAVQRQTALPWHRRGWQTWPLSLQFVSFAVLVAGFTCLCLAGWRVTSSGATEPVSGFFGLLGKMGELIALVAHALILSVQQLNTLWLAAIALVLAAGWFSCVGLSTALVRLAGQRR